MVAFHAGLPVPGGFTGVDIFFVISGYVITALILRERALGRWSAAVFYARRAKRLLPALALMTFVVLVLSLLLESPYGPQQVTAATGIGAMLLAANLVIARTVGGYFDPAAEANPLLHTWSLSVEEQFYLVFPLVILGGIALSARWWRKASNPRGPLLVVALLTLGSFLVSLLLTFGGSWIAFTDQPQTWAFYSSPTRAWEFGVGALIAISAGALSRRRNAGGLQAALTWFGVVVIVIGLFAINDTTPFPGFAALLPVLGTAAVIAAGHLHSGKTNGNAADSTLVHRFLASTPMVRIGDGSYSIYLWHWPIILFAVALFPNPWTAPIAALVSFIPAWLAYRLVEQPIRSAPMPRLRTVLALGVATSGAVILAAVLLLVIGPRTAAYAQDQGVPTLGVQTGCLLVDTTFTPADLARCTFPVNAANATGSPSQGLIILAGDSHADSLSNGVVAAGHALGYDVMALTGGDCPLIRQTQANSRVTNCPELVDAVMDVALGAGDQPASLVVLGHRGVPNDLHRTVAELTTAGIPVLLARDVPRWRPFGAALGPNPCQGGLVNATCELPRDEVASISAETRQREEQLAEQFPALELWDPWPIFCDQERCSAVLDGRLAYGDDSHLNGLGSAATAGPLRQAISQVLQGR